MAHAGYQSPSLSVSLRATALSLLMLTGCGGGGDSDDDLPPLPETTSVVISGVASVGANLSGVVSVFKINEDGQVERDQTPLGETHTNDDGQYQVTIAGAPNSAIIVEFTSDPEKTIVCALPLCSRSNDSNGSGVSFGESYTPVPRISLSGVVVLTDNAEPASTSAQVTRAHGSDHSYTVNLTPFSEIAAQLALDTVRGGEGLQTAVYSSNGKVANRFALPGGDTISLTTIDLTKVDAVRNAPETVLINSLKSAGLVASAFDRKPVSTSIAQILSDLTTDYVDAGISDLYAPSDGCSAEESCEINQPTSIEDTLTASLQIAELILESVTDDSDLAAAKSAVDDALQDVETNGTQIPSQGEFTDTDNDGIDNATDTDDDGDGVEDSSDAFPLDGSEWLDTDGDTIGNNADTDDDNDGVSDDQDAFPLDSNETTDTDGDGIGNNADPDDDNDGVSDDQDAFPLDSSETTDSDGDGIGDNADPDTSSNVITQYNAVEIFNLYRGSPGDNGNIPYAEELHSAGTFKVELSTDTPNPAWTASKPTDFYYAYEYAFSVDRIGGADQLNWFDIGAETGGSYSFPLEYRADRSFSVSLPEYVSEPDPGDEHQETYIESANVVDFAHLPNLTTTGGYWSNWYTPAATYRYTNGSTDFNDKIHDSFLVSTVLMLPQADNLSLSDLATSYGEVFIGSNIAVSASDADIEYYAGDDLLLSGTSPESRIFTDVRSYSVGRNTSSGIATNNRFENLDEIEMTLFLNEEGAFKLDYVIDGTEFSGVGIASPGGTFLSYVEQYGFCSNGSSAIRMTCPNGSEPESASEFTVFAVPLADSPSLSANQTYQYISFEYDNRGGSESCQGNLNVTTGNANTYVLTLVTPTCKVMARTGSSETSLPSLTTETRGNSELHMRFEGLALVSETNNEIRGYVSADQNNLILRFADPNDPAFVGIILASKVAN